MSYSPDYYTKKPVLGLLEKNNPGTSQTLQNQNVGNIAFTDNSNSTYNNDLDLLNKDSLVFAHFSREDETDNTTVSILVGDSSDETRLARVIGNSDGSVKYRYQSDSLAIDKISSLNGLNIRKHYTNSNTATVDYGDGSYIFFIRMID